MVKIGSIIGKIWPKSAQNINNVSTALVDQSPKLPELKQDVVKLSKKVEEITPIFVSEFKQVNKNILRLLSDLEKKYTSVRAVSHNGIDVGVQSINFHPHIKAPIYNGSEMALYKAYQSNSCTIICDVKPPSNVKTRPVRYFIDPSGRVERQVLMGGSKSKTLSDAQEAQNLIQVIKNICNEVDIY